MSDINFILIMPAAILATASPGPATLAVLSTSMAHGRKDGLIVAFGLWTGALLWSLTAAFGFSALMASNAWMMSGFKLVGAAYLLFLSYKSAQAALRPQNTMEIPPPNRSSALLTYRKGLLIQLSNPKAPLYFGSLYSVAVPTTVTMMELSQLILVLALNSFIILNSYALLFSTVKARKIFNKLRRGFETVFSVFFGFLGFKLITQ